MLRLRTTLLLCLLFGLPGSLLPIPNAQAASGLCYGQLTVTNTTTKPVNGAYTRTTESKLGRTVTAVSPHSVIVQQYGPGDATPYTTVNQQFNGFGQPGDTAHSVHGLTQVEYDDKFRVERLIRPQSGKSATVINYKDGTTIAETVTDGDGATTTETGLDGYPGRTHGGGAYDTTVTHDEHGRLHTLTTSGQAGNVTTTWTYHDDNGLPEHKLINGDIVESNQWHSDGRLAWTVDAKGVRTTRFYHPTTKDLIKLGLTDNGNAGNPGAMLPRKLNAAEALARFGMASPIITMVTPEPGSPPDTIIEDYNRRGMPGKITIENGASIELDYSTADGNRAQVTAERVAIPSPPDAALNRAAASSLSYREDPTTAFTTATVHSVEWSGTGGGGGGAPAFAAKAVGAPDAATQTRDYNPRGQLETLRQGPPGNQIEVRYRYLHGTDWVRHVGLFRNGSFVKGRQITHDPFNGRTDNISVTNATGTVLASFAYTYHPDSDRIHTISREDGSVWTYDYNDAFFHLTDAEYTAAANSGTADLSWHYDYDGIGNRIGQEMPGIPGSRVEFENSAENFQLSRDHLGRILLVGSYSGTTNNLRLRVNGTSATIQGTQFHAVLDVSTNSLPTNLSVRVTAAWEELDPAAGQPAECASVVTGAVYLPAVLPQLQYTANGDLAHDGVNHYLWDGYDNLHAVVQTNQPNWRMEKYTYDAMRRRTSRTIFYDPAKSGNWIADQTHTYFYDDWNPIREDIANAFGPVRSLEYVWGPDLVGQSAGGHAAQGAGGVGGLLAVIDTPAAGGVPRTLLPLTDHLGTTHLLLDPATGATTRFRYAPFGEPLARDAGTGGGADPDGVFGHLYSTKPWNADTGLYYYGYRYYHPRSGRWISRDPIAEDGGLNLFGFCSNDPISFLDYLGMADISSVKRDLDDMATVLDPEWMESLRHMSVRVSDGGFDSTRRWYMENGKPYIEYTSYKYKSLRWGKGERVKREVHSLQELWTYFKYENNAIVPNSPRIIGFKHRDSSVVFGEMARVLRDGRITATTVYGTGAALGGAAPFAPAAATAVVSEASITGLAIKSAATGEMASLTGTAVLWSGRIRATLTGAFELSGASGGMSPLAYGYAGAGVAAGPGRARTSGVLGKIKGFFMSTDESAQKFTWNTFKGTGPRATGTAFIQGPVSPRHFSETEEGIRLFKEAKAYRNQLTANGADMGFRNIAIVDVMVDDVPRRVRFLNTPFGPHSEARLVKWVELMVSRGHSVEVKRLFSDRIPCGPTRENCARLLGDAFGKHLEVYYNILKGEL